MICAQAGNRQKEETTPTFYDIRQTTTTLSQRKINWFGESSRLLEFDRPLTEPGASKLTKVFLATRKLDGMKVAIKRIKQKEEEASMGLSFSALRELRLMREMRHENLVSLIDVYAEHAHLHLVLEVLATDLEKVIARIPRGTAVISRSRHERACLFSPSPFPPALLPWLP